MSGADRPLEGRPIIVTGATKGIGAATAQSLAAAGALVVATGRDQAGGRETERLIREAGGQGIFLAHDIVSEADWRQVIAATEARFGPLYGLINNAGLFFVKPLAETTEQDFDAIHQVNVEGTFLGVKHALRAFARSSVAGVIVNVSSLMGLVGFPGATAYCATKGALTGLTKAAAREGAQMNPKVRVNSLHPGVIWTPMITGQFGEDQALADAFAAETPLRLIGLPQYMADALLFLVSDESAYVTGAELVVDGGRGAD